MQHPAMIFPLPPATHPTIHLSRWNVLTAWSKVPMDPPILYLDEATMEWKPFSYLEKRDARKTD